MENTETITKTDEQKEDERLSRLFNFSAIIADRLKDAIDGRRESGIEERWLEDEEMFAGIDDANRGEKMLKPATSDGRVTLSTKGTGSGRSTVFANITAPYCKMGKSRVSEMLLPSEDKPFSINPMPMPDIVKLQNSDATMPGAADKVSDVAKAFIEQAEKSAEKAETQIWEWLCESMWHTEMRKIIGQAAKLGSGVIKGPYPTRRKYQRANKGPDGSLSIEIEEKIAPAVSWIDVWNLFPDPACGSDIHDGNYIFERELFTGKKLRELRGQPGFLDSVIDEVLKEGPDTTRKAQDQRGDSSSKYEKEKYEVFYYYGEAKQGDYESARPDSEEYGEILNVVVVMVNGKIIKASINPLNSGEFPYDVIVWEAIEDFWAGEGIARQVNAPQRIGNAAIRWMMNNAGISAGPQIILDRGAIEPADGSWDLTPLKIWFKMADSDIDDIRKAFMSITIPSMQVELQNTLKMAMDLAEKLTNMPLIMQGQQGSATETVGGMEILQTNSSSVLRDIAVIFDNAVKRLISRFYEWLLLYGEDIDAKAEFEILPQGSTSFYERDAQNEFILKLEPFANDASYGLNKNKIMEELLKANKISPSRVMYSDAEMEQQAKERAANPPVDPRVQGMVEVEKLRQQGDQAKEQTRQQIDQAEMQAEMQANQSDLAAKIHLQQMDHESKKELLQMQLNLKMMELSQNQGVSLDTIKAQLAQTTMKLQTQKQLSQQAMEVDAGKQGRDHAHERATQIIDQNHERNMQALTPPTEPEGRAKDGKAWEE